MLRRHSTCTMSWAAPDGSSRSRPDTPRRWRRSGAGAEARRLVDEVVEHFRHHGSRRHQRTDVPEPFGTAHD